MNTEQKIDVILRGQTEMKVELARFLVHQENHAKKIDEHEEHLQILNEYKNQWIGKTTVISLFFGLIGAGITKLIEFISSSHQ